MKSTKKSPMRKNQLNSNSTLFLQLGILLALVLVYTAFELKFVKTVFNLPDKTVSTDEPDTFVFPPFEVEKQESPKEKIKQKTPKLLDDFIINNTDSKTEEDIIVIKPEPTINYDSIFSDIPEIDDSLKDETIPFVLVEQAPRYPGCKEKSEEAYKKCFNEKLKKFVAKKFNPNLDTNLSGKQKIYVLFKIDKNGDIVDIKARAPHKRLETEAIKVVKKLPKMEPGKQRTRTVGVKYVLPISLHLE